MCYPAVFTYEESKEIAVEFPDLGCATSGVDDIDAFFSARELLGCVVVGLEEDGEELPSPTNTLPAWLNAAALERNINFSQVL